MEKITKSSDTVLIDPNEPLILPDGTALVGRVEWFLYALCCLDYQNLPTPMSRIEEFANALITGEIPNIEPQSRAEQFFLAILDGNVSNLPQPQSRSEILLDKLARGEFDLSDVEPIQSSYELLLAYLIKNGGIGNIDYVLYEFSEAMKTMYNTVEKPFKSLELSGNTLVNCVLEDTENDDYTSFDEDYSGTSFTINGTSEGAIKSAILKGNTLINSLRITNVFAPANIETTVNLGLQTTLPPKKYILFYNVVTENTSPNEHLNRHTPRINLKDGSSLYHGYEGFNTTPGRKYWIFTANSDIVDVYYWVKCISTDVTVNNCMLLEYQEGMENWDIPYFEGMQSVKMPVLTTTGKNLFNGGIVQGSVSTDNGVTITTDSAIRSDDYIELIGGETYTISKTKGTKTIAIVIYDENKKFVRPVWDKTFTLNTNEKYIKFADSENDLTNLYQIEKGVNSSSYEPYKSNILSCNEDVTLRGINNKKDTLDYDSGIKTGMIGEMVLKGTEDYTQWTVGNQTAEGMIGIYTRKDTIDATENDGAYILCDKLPIAYRTNLKNTTENSVIKGNGYIGIVMKANSVDEVKAWLRENPVTVQYGLKSAVNKEVQIDIVDQDGTKIDKMHVFDEVTHVNASSDELTPTVNIGKSVSYPTIIKPNTKYTVDLKRNDKPLTVNLGGTEVTFVDGETRKTITTPSTLTNDKLSYYGVGAKCNEIMLIEGEIERNVDYFTGMQSVVMQNQMPILHTVGKNLFDGVSYIDGFIANSNNYIVSPDTDVTSIIFNVNKNTDYILSAKTNFNRGIIGGSVQPITIGTKTTKIEGYRVSNTIKFNSGEFTNIIIYLNSSKIDIEDIQVEEGSVSTTYEPYKSSILSCNEDVTLRGIGNVKDKLDCLTGEVTERIGEVVLDGSENWSFHSTNNYFWYATRQELNATNENPISDKLIIKTGNANFPQIHPFGDVDTLEKFKSWLADNKPIMQYKLATESIKTVDLNVVDQNGNTIPKIKSYKDVTHLEVTVPKQSLLPNVSAEVATDNSKDMSSLTTKHQEISETQSAIQDNIQFQSDEIDTALMATAEIFESILE